MKVRKVLTPLARPALTRLCRKREQKISGKNHEIRKRLAYFYRGDLAELVRDLRRQDLLKVASEYSDSVEFPPGLPALKASELREVCTAVFEKRYVAPEGSVGETIEDGEEEEQQSEGPGRGRFDIVLHATSCAVGLGAGHVDENSLKKMAKDADSVTILSAYYVPDVLRAIAGACRGDVKVVLNGLGGRRLATQVKELRSLQEELRKRSRSAEVQLAFAEGLFHTKLYLFGRGSESVAWIGSANATRAGLNGRNEEVLVRVTPVPRSVLAYVESAWSRAVPVLSCPEAVNSLPDFFRTGVLHYKPYAILQTTINPFRHLIEVLPETEKQKISRFRSDFADNEGGIGAFNLNLMFKSVAEPESEEPPVGRGQVRLRPFAVETCYGYWVAERFVPDVDAKLRKASDQKRRRLEAMRDWLRTDRDAIVGAYGSYLRDVRRMLRDARVEWREHAKPGLFEDLSAIKRRVASLPAALSSERLARHCQAFVPSEVPEIWEDDAAYGSFSETFFDSLAYAWSSQKRTGSAKLIIESLTPFLELGDLSTDPAKEIRRALELALRQEGWYEENFG